MDIIDNDELTLADDLKTTIKKESDINIIADSFSIFAFKELYRPLKNIERFRFIFTSPTFTNQQKKEQREFYIPQQNREKNLYGTELEVKLRNELTQNSISRDCVKWIEEKAEFKSNNNFNRKINGFITVKNTNNDITSYSPINDFTASEILGETENNLINKIGTVNSKYYIRHFNNYWNDDEFLSVTDKIIENIKTIYAENSPELIYLLTLFNIFREYLETVSEDFMPNDANGFKDSVIYNMLYDFQKDAVTSIINKLEKYNGCILADSVGLGKTFTALAVIKYYENKNKSVLVLCPKKLSENWNTYRENYKTNILLKDRLNYDVLFHTDLSRIKGESNGKDLERINWNNYDLIVIDESHNFRNGEDVNKVNRYSQLLNKVIKSGVRTKILMLSATPVNNTFDDLKNQFYLIAEGDFNSLENKLDISKPIDKVFYSVNKEFNKLKNGNVKINDVKNRIETDFFKLLENLTLGRSRSHIQKYYNFGDIGRFPNKLKPISIAPKLTDIENITYTDIYEKLNSLSLAIYLSATYILDSKKEKYANKYKSSLSIEGRQKGIEFLIRKNLMKRLESSIFSFVTTLKKIKEKIEKEIKYIEQYSQKDKILEDDLSDENFDDEEIDYIEDQNFKISLQDMDYISWLEDLKDDFVKFEDIISTVEKITLNTDKKLQELLNLISDKIENPINGNNKKIIIFTAFADTAEYLYKNLSEKIKAKYNIESALITGRGTRTTLKGISNKYNDILTNFSPISKNREITVSKEIDLLIATDCISEGQNLQDCDFLINYDIHWNPVKIIQRFGRIDRIGSKNKNIQLVNFWPDIELDEYLNLTQRVKNKMRQVIISGSGEKNIIEDDNYELEYRNEQLKKLKNEVLEFEDVSGKISITDLGLNEFKTDLLNYRKANDELSKKPLGLHAIVARDSDTEEGVIFLLRELREDNKTNNPLFPFFLTYIGKNGNIIFDYQQPKKILELMRKLCYGRKNPDLQLCKIFNEKTDDGRNMSEYSRLLNKMINSITKAKKEEEQMKIFTDEIMENITAYSVNDFELIHFLVIEKA